MVQEMYILPVRCKRCNAVFDLWYELQKEDQAEIITNYNKNLNQFLCWHCRQKFVKEWESKFEYENELEVDDEISYEFE
ncbi:hypothetical protein HYV50_00550 [Candidatus Pacearchaeota archaeon]|nr:hypothetical protein [Candidatus Pacearchaeota archaeon]